MLPLDPTRHFVTAVVVTHDGDRWLPETLRALRGQSRPIQRVIGVDTGSRDRSAAVLAEHIADDAIVSLPARTGYGAAIQAALDHPRARAEYPRGPDSTEWIWLIHDDCAPDTDALYHLLRAADDDPRAAVLGPKLRDWFDRRLLLEVGVTIDGAGRRETGLEPREFDQGQHDGTRQVLAVSSAGMLVRRDVWDALRGFDPGLALFRDDIDFCWRAGGAGHRVLVVTDAIAYHAEASARRRRSIAVAGDHPRRIDRRNAIYVLLANMPFGAMVGSLLRNTVASFFRVLLYIVAKQPASALDEFLAITSVYLMPLRLVRARYRRRRGRRRTYSAIQPFLARGVALRQLAELGANLMTGSPESGGRHQASGGAPPSGEDDDDPLRDDHGLLRRLITHPGVLLVVGLTLVTLIAERSLLFGDRLAGGALVPVGGDAWDLWALYLASWHEVGIGSGAAAPPYVGMLAILSTLTFGQPWLAVTIILLGCVPLAGFTAYLLARRVLNYRPAQLWMAASYALLPVATGAVAQGRVGTALVHALLPVLGLLVTRLLTLPPRPSRRSAWALALLLTLATAFVPLVWPLAALTGVLIAVAFGNTQRRLNTSLAIALIVPLVLLVPWTFRLFRHPSLWLLEAGLHRPQLSDPALPAEALLLLSPGGPGVPPIWVTAGFLTAALCALLLRRRRLLVAAGWGVALVGILIAILASRMNLAVPDGGPVAAAWPGVAIAFAATAMLLSAATAAQSFDEMFRLGGIRRAGAALVALLALTTPVAAAGLWMWNGVEGPVTARGGPVFPPFIESLSADGTQPRTLVIRPGAEGTVEYSVLRGREPRIGEAQIPPEEEISAEVDRIVAQLAGGRGGDETAELAEFGIRYVLLPAPARTDDDEPRRGPDRVLVNRLDSTPGMQRLNLTPDYAIWRLEEETGQLRIVDPRSDAQPTVLDSEESPVWIPPGSATRLLVLAEPASDQWTASLDGTELRPTRTPAGLQAFELPSAGGDLEIDHDNRLRQSWLLAQAVLFGVVLILALPGARTEEDIRAAATQPRPEPRIRPRPRRESAGSRRAPRTGRHGRGRRARETAPPSRDTDTSRDGAPTDGGEAER